MHHCKSFIGPMQYLIAGSLECVPPRESVDKTQYGIVNLFTECVITTGTRTATFMAVVDPGMHISFLFARCRYRSFFAILLLTI